MAEICINTGKEQMEGEVNNALGQNDSINITENTTENNIYIPPFLPP